jgi:hypothetical protein
MQTQTPISTLFASAARRAAAPTRAPSPTVRHEHRTRDFGVGYGNSSGYVSRRRYADNWGNARFVCG